MLRRGDIVQKLLGTTARAFAVLGAYGQTVLLGRLQRNKKKTKGSFADQYLSPWHRDNPGDGWTMAALATEVARSTPELKAVFEQGLEDILSAKGGHRNEAIFQAAAMIAGVVLARAVQDPRLSDEILKSVRQKPQPVGDVERDVLEIVLACATHFDVAERRAHIPDC